jgi:two-component system sensor histidine kinase MprB
MKAEVQAWLRRRGGGLGRLLHVSALQAPTFRTRIVIAATVALAAAMAATTVAVYSIVRSELKSQVDSTLAADAQRIEHMSFIVTLRPGAPPVLVPRGGPFEQASSLQVVTSRGQLIRVRSLSGLQPRLPVTKAVLAVAAGSRGSTSFDAHVLQTHVRILAVNVRRATPERVGLAVEVAAPLSGVDRELQKIRDWIFLIFLVGLGVAALLGLLVSRTALRPIANLMRATEHVRETGDLAERIDVEGTDELARLATSFNGMLASLEQAERTQRQLVADASHELRTPLTSLRVNIEMLLRGELEDDPEERERLLLDVAEQIDELTALISGVLELARSDARESAEEASELRFDELVAEAVGHAELHYPDVRFELARTPTTLVGRRSAIARAVSNLVDNAGKWSAPGDTVEVTADRAGLVVRDHGPGVDPTDLPFVFDRFYRARAARKLPGSGIGLAIVKQVAQTHGGDVELEPAEGGGAIARLRLPGLAPARDAAAFAGTPRDPGGS